MIRVLIVLTAVVFQSSLMAVQHAGSVRWGERPLPGATVTAIQGEKKLLSTTDEEGNYSFQDLGPGEWRVEVEMYGFAPLSKTLQVGAEAPTLEFQADLKPRASAAPVPSSAPRPAPQPEAAQPLAAAKAAPAAPVRSAESKETKKSSSRGKSSTGRKPGEGGFVALTLNASTGDPV